MLISKYPGIFTCPSCSALFTCLSYFQQHVKGHANREGKRLYCCQHCRYSTEQEFNFQWHTMTHEDEPPHSCNVCNKSEDVDASSHQSSKSIKTEAENEEEPASCSMVGKRSVATATTDDLYVSPNSSETNKYEEDEDEDDDESEEEDDEDNQEQSGHLSLQPMIPILNQNSINQNSNEISDDEDDEEEEVESEEDVETEYQHTNQNSSDDMLVNYDIINQGPPYAESIDRMETSLTPMVPAQSRGRGKGNRKSRSINSNDSSDGTSLGEMRRKFHCSHCGKSFKTKSHLQRHILTHTGEKPYHCNRCGSKFNQSSSLRNHIIAIHTKEYPHYCSECGKGFLMPALLQKHLTTSHRTK